MSIEAHDHRITCAHCSWGTDLEHVTDCAECKDGICATCEGLGEKCPNMRTCSRCERRFNPEEETRSVGGDLPFCGICGVKLWLQGAEDRHVPELKAELAALEAKVASERKEGAA